MDIASPIPPHQPPPRRPNPRLGYLFALIFVVLTIASTALAFVTYARSKHLEGRFQALQASVKAEADARAAAEAAAASKPKEDAGPTAPEMAQVTLLAKKAVAGLEESVEGLRKDALPIQEWIKLKQLADKAIAHGFRSNLNSLHEIYRTTSDPFLKDAANNEIIRVELFYLQSDHFLPQSAPIRINGESTFLDERLTTKSLAAILLDGEQPWQLRARSAELLATRFEVMAVEAVLNATLYDPNLSTVYQATRSYKELTGCPLQVVFGGNELSTWSEANKVAITERLDQLRVSTPSQIGPPRPAKSP